MVDFRMPSLGADMDAGTVSEWRVHPGDVVHRGDIVAVVETDKADIDVEVFEDGAVEELLVPVGVRVPVGTPLARLATTSSAPSISAPSLSAGPPAGAPTPLVTPATQPTRPGIAPSASRVWSPLVRHLAEAHGVDLTRVAGTGPGGTIRRDDVQQVIRARSGRTPRASPRARHLAATLAIDVSQISGTGPGGSLTGDDVLRGRRCLPGAREASQRRAVGELMARAKREIPHYYLSLDVELGDLLDRLRARNEERPPQQRVLPAALLLHAVARAASTVAGFNGRWEDQRGFVPADGVHLGIAVALRDGGLVAPTLHDADRCDLDQLMAALRDLVQRARNGHLTAAEMSDATLTVTNLGDRGAGAVFGVIVPPQVAILGVGRIESRPWVVDDQPDPRIEARPVVTVTLSADHRVTNGHEGSRFLDAIATHLHVQEEP